MKLGRMLFSFLLMAVGVLLLLINVNVLMLEWYNQWPLVLILGGFAMLCAYLDQHSDWGWVIPATILILYGVLLYVCANLTWWYMTSLWPVFILAPGLALLAPGVLGHRYVGLTISGWITTGVGLLFLLQTLLRDFSIFLPLLFIFSGIAVLLSTALKGRKKHD